jgi:hypothetical protein
MGSRNGIFKMVVLNQYSFVGMDYIMEWTKVGIHKEIEIFLYNGKNKELMDHK